MNTFSQMLGAISKDSNLVIFDLLATSTMLLDAVEKYLLKISKLRILLNTNLILSERH